MFEPIDAPVTPPMGGWPSVVFRVEFLPDVRLQMAAYELACLSRKYRIGFVAELDGFDMYAFPQQTADAIARGYTALRQQAIQNQPDVLATAITRWTPLRKAAVVDAIREGRLTREDAIAIFDLSEDELAGWEARYARMGVEGLTLHSLRVAR